MDRMDERKAIASEIDAHAEAWRTVNEQPEVQAARAAARAAQKAANEADEHFRSVFSKYAPRDDERARRLQEQHPGLLLLGDEFPRVCRCAVSGLPVFEGDKVFMAGEPDDIDVAYILADAVELKPEFAYLEPTVAKAEPHVVYEFVTDEEEAA